MTHSNTYILSCIYQLSFLFSTVHTSQVPHRLLPHKAHFRFLLMALKKSAVVKSVQRRSRLISVGCGLSGLSCSSFVSAQKTDRKRLKMYLVTGKQLLQFCVWCFHPTTPPSTTLLPDLIAPPSLGWKLGLCCPVWGCSKLSMKQVLDLLCHKTSWLFSNNNAQAILEKHR